MQLAFTTHLPFRYSRKSSMPARELLHTGSASQTQLARRAAESQDCAFYSCPCGFAFTAAVSTSVGCPHCGTAQAW